MFTDIQDPPREAWEVHIPNISCWICSAYELGTIPMYQIAFKHIGGIDCPSMTSKLRSSTTWNCLRRSFTPTLWTPVRPHGSRGVAALHLIT
ncbi:hypothetical protein L195_g059826 [Trifolium pratense]|uniref:Uncharacterized protein n=1 Tax=Trifolium pratense TaxID=57577 RepID=A0A2K3K0E4_TRIPR|nr:hypothetical protein L195_g059826 [Trifolium pratense]